MSKLWKDLSFTKPQKAVLFLFAFVNVIASLYEVEENDGNMLWYYMLVSFVSTMLGFKNKED